MGEVAGLGHAGAQATIDPFGAALVFDVDVIEQGFELFEVALRIRVIGKIW